MRLSLCLGLVLFAAIIMPLQARAPACVPVTTEQIGRLFDRWNASLATLNPEEVVKNCADDAVLLATISDKPRLTQADRIDDFRDSLKLRPQGVIDNRTVRLGCNSAVDVGTYTFTLGDGTKVAARDTFTYEYKNGGWLINSHHSSAMPGR